MENRGVWSLSHPVIFLLRSYEVKGEGTRLVFAWIDDLKLKLRDRERRAYYALREAQALRMQYGSGAEAWCVRQLAKPKLHERRRRFLLLVQKALLTE